MILKALTLENFKGIREPVRIEFAPLTLLFGPNNAGKSTIVQALMYAREVLERNNCDAGRTELGGDVVDLGGFRSLVHGHDPARNIRMRFELTVAPGALTDPIAFGDPEDSDDLADSDADEELESDDRSTHFNISALTEARVVWVELEIAQPSSGSHLKDTPTVTCYSVGSGFAAYAKIALNESSGNTELSFLDNSMFPVVATRYFKGEQSDFEWDLSRIARAKLRHVLDTSDLPKIGLKKNAKVAVRDEPLQSGDNRMSRADFDARVAQIVNGEGPWGDDTIDPETGEQNPKYKIRHDLIKLAEAAGRRRAELSQWLVEHEKREPPEGTDEWFDWMFLSDSPPMSGDASRLFALGWLTQGQLDETKEIDGLLPVPGPLTIRGTALPAWDEPLETFQKETGQEDAILRSLSQFIVRPGKLLLDALLDAVYLGPYRRLPSRHYRLQDAPAAVDWASGLTAWQLLMGEGSQLLVDSVNDWLSASERGFGTEYRIVIRRYKSLDLDSPLWCELMSGDLSVSAESIRQKLAELPEEARKLEFETRGLTLAPQDLGVGISQVVPVLVAALHNDARIVAIEEPESNIHPAFQVVLADLFMTQAKANPNVLFLIETHSEHLMLRCLRRIRETAKGLQTEGAPVVVPDDIAVHFVEPGKDAPRIRRIEIDEEGDFIDEWPGGFFEESFQEKFAGR